MKQKWPPPTYQNPWPVAKNNFIMPLRDLPVENAEMGSEGNSIETPGTDERMGKGRPPPIVLTLEANLFCLQRELKSVMSGDFFFQNTATGTGATTKSMVDYNAIQKFLNEKNHFFTFYTKVDKPVKIVIRHLPGNTSAEDITVALQEM
jgi:hypothetical protein